MIKRIFILCIVLAILFAFFAGSAVVSAEEENSGFIQCHTKASINFEEVVEFTLTNKETGETITKRLYWVNEYEGNFSVPFGTYSVSATVVVESGWAGGTYEVICSPEEITVNKSRLAESLGFRVEEIAAGDVSEDAWPEDESETGVPEAPEGTGFSEDQPGGQSGENIGSETERTPAPSANNREPHPIIGLVVTAVVLLVAGAIIFYIMWRRENPDLD